MSCPSSFGMDGAKDVRSQHRDSMMMTTMLGRLAMAFPDTWRT